MELCVHKVCQSSSGGDYVTIYEAELEFVVEDPTVEVTVLNSYPANADPTDVELAREAIRCGAESVLRPYGMGAIILVQRVVIHLTDFKPSRFERFTAEELQRILVERA